MSKERSRPRRVAWVTGAGKGIGRAVARQMAEDGWTVAASARSETDLQEFAAEAAPLSGRIVPYVLDISDGDRVRQVFLDIESGLGLPDWVVLNAGTHRPVDGAKFDADLALGLIQTNLAGSIHCLAPVIEGFVARGSGRIGVVASLAGYRGLPGASAYGASKAGLINLCEALRPELLPHGVTLSVINPGFVRTPLTDRNTFKMPFLMDVDVAARRIVEGMDSRRFEIAFPRRFAWLMKLVRLMPYAIFFMLTKIIVARTQD
ncbi:MAG: oxidoreductase [Alphaproteobacteria bacterium]|nr:oxidoreductase [Alphaproteobacteria bacterium]